MNYFVSVTALPFGGMDYGSVKYAHEKDPEKAIRKWCEYSKKYPTCVSIQPETKEDGMSLIKWAAENLERVRAVLSESKCPYRIDWMLHEIQRQACDGMTSMQWDGDQLHPFTMG